MILDANLLVYAADDQSPHHATTRSWLDRVLDGQRRVGLPWQTIGAFVRIATNPRIYEAPLDPEKAWSIVQALLSRSSTWIPPATERTAAILGRLIEQHRVTGNLVPDAQLAALAIEHGLVLYSADTDFARFDELRWENPLTGR